MHKLEIAPNDKVHIWRYDVFCRPFKTVYDLKDVKPDSFEEMNTFYKFRMQTVDTRLAWMVHKSGVVL